MNKLIDLLIAAVIFGVIVYFLIPMLPSPFKSFVLIIVVVIAIVYLLGELSGYAWPWK